MRPSRLLEAKVFAILIQCSRTWLSATVLVSDETTKRHTHLRTDSRGWTMSTDKYCILRSLKTNINVRVNLTYI